MGKSHFIPMPRHEVKERLFAEPAIAPLIEEGLESVCTMLEALDHHNSLSVLERLKVLYSAMDPDAERQLDLAEVDSFISSFEEVLVDGNWEHVTDEEFQLALDGESLFPISMDVRLDEFVTMKLYKLGHDEMTESLPNALDNLLGRPGKEVKFDMFNRVIQVIRFQESEWFVEQGRKKHDPGDMGAGLHLRLFKNVPVEDLEAGLVVADFDRGPVHSECFAGREPRFCVVARVDVDVEFETLVGEDVPIAVTVPVGYLESVAIGDL